jgi:hypothetical protein
MLQAYVCKCFICLRRMLQKIFYVASVAYDQAREVGVDGGGPLMCAGSEAGVAALTCVRRRMCTTAGGGAGPAGATAGAHR